MIAVLLLCIVPVFDGFARDSVELVEVNHCYDESTGEERFISVNYYRRHGRVLHVCEWHMRKNECIYQVRAGAGYRSIFERDAGDVLLIHAKRFAETWTWHDPEERDRIDWPLWKRRALGR